ncbi:uncharacterized protein Tco025E_00855 [Trypanosoma conorhini]|uniref:Uncharacterized protein n=1 Tax=Trypanosoma conorhini TaxID=83891 RepID=A0A422QA90_9TRYP|nr:uncharacterized protein Tco025E_00855 [Trypanosoma conorhini]RNF26892.1 hypothetical protein Tco025E_00855 [Trypanosoma conorhini]
MARKQKRNVPPEGTAAASSGPEATVLDDAAGNESAQSSGDGDVLLDTQAPREAPDLEHEASLNSDLPLSSQQGGGARSALMEVQKRTRREGKDTAGMGQFLYIHFYLWPIKGPQSGTPSLDHLNPRLQKLARSVESLFPPGTSFDVRREVRLNRHLNQRDHRYCNKIHKNQDMLKFKITLCEEHRFIPAEFANALSPCDELPFHMAFVFDPTLVAEVTHYKNIRCPPKRESGTTEGTYFVAVFRGVQVSSIRELVDAFFRAYLEKTEAELEKNHPFPLISTATSCPVQEPSVSTTAEADDTGQEKPAKKSDTIPVEFVSPRAFLEEKEHHKLINGPVQQVLVRDRQLGVMVLGRACDKNIIGPPARPATGARRVLASKGSEQSSTHSAQSRSADVILHVPSPLLPPFTLWHLTGATVEAVGVFTRSSSSTPEFRVRCSSHDDDDDDGDDDDENNDNVVLAQWAQKLKKKRTREGKIPLTQDVMNLKDAHKLLSGRQAKEKSMQGKRTRSTSSVPLADVESLTHYGEALDAFRLHDEMGPTLGWLLRSSTAFVID